MRIVQILPTLAYGDAVGNDVIAIDKTLRKAGYATGIYAENIGGRIPLGTAHHISKMPELKEEDIILYHLSVGTELNFKLPKYKGKKVVIYHNITPYTFFSGYHQDLWRACKYGMEGAKFLSDKVTCCLADSEYNKQDLRKMGYKCPIDVLPILIPFDDYKKSPSKEVLEKYSDDEFVNILFTGRVVPHKCQEDIIAAYYQYYKNYNDKSRLILVGSYGQMDVYYNKLKKYTKELGIEENVIFSGHIGFDEILAYYHIADIFVCMSEHEGFCVPLVEAMFFNLPIVAYDSSAIGDTLGGSGFLIDEKNPLETAGVINYILENNSVKEELLQGQRKRLKDFEHDIIEGQLLSFLNRMM